MELLDAIDFPALGTGCRVVTAAEKLDGAYEIVAAQLDAIDIACSRFRDDSELMRVNARAGSWVSVSPLFLQALDFALRAARITGGVVDPTVGDVMRAIGYHTDFDQIGEVPYVVKVATVPGWRAVDVDHAEGRVRVAKDASLDLGATAKALAADLSAQRAAADVGTGVLVSLGGDIAVSGVAPDGGWCVEIGNSHAGGLVQQTVAFSQGGLATSSTSVRRWIVAGRQMHHIVDPTTGLPAESNWRTVSVFAGSCADANVASTAAVVMAGDAPAWLKAQGVSARLVGNDDSVITVNDWPEEM